MEEKNNEIKECPTKKKSMKTGIIIGIILIVFIAVNVFLFSLAENKTIIFDKNTATAYETYGLTCYHPTDWITDSPSEEEKNAGAEIAAYWIDEEEFNAEINYFYIGTFEEENIDSEWKIIANELPNAEEINIPGCSKAIYSMQESEDNISEMEFILLCDRTVFYVCALSKSQYFDEEIFIKIISAADYVDFKSENVCDSLGGHNVDEWTETKASTCKEPGTQTGTCNQCYTMITEELPLAPHTVENGKTTESTCKEKGSVTGICSVCEAEVTEELPLAEHTAGDWIVDKEATESTEGKRHKECTKCGKEMESEPFTLTLEEIKATYNTGITFNDLSRNPDSFKNEKVKFRGRVLQVIEGGTDTQLRIATSGRYNDVILVQYPSDIVSSRVLENDTITIYGKFLRLHTYESVGFGMVTVPAVLVDYIDQ